MGVTRKPTRLRYQRLKGKRVSKQENNSKKEVESQKGPESVKAKSKDCKEGKETEQVDCHENTFDRASEIHLYMGI